MFCPVILKARAKYFSHVNTSDIMLHLPVHHESYSSLQYFPHKKRLMSNKNLENAKAIKFVYGPLLVLQSHAGKQLSPCTFKNGKVKFPLTLLSK